MPNLENLKDMVAEKIEGQEGEVLYSPVDLKYAYRQMPLHESTARHCNFISWMASRPGLTVL